MKWVAALLARLRRLRNNVGAIEVGEPDWDKAAAEFAGMDPLSDEFKALDRRARARATAAQDDADRASIKRAAERRAPTGVQYDQATKDRIVTAMTRRYPASLDTGADI